MVHHDTPPADPPLSTPPGARADRDGPGDSVPAGRILPGGLRVLGRMGSTAEGTLYRAEYLTGLEVVLVILRPLAGGAEPLRRERVGRAMQIRHPNVAGVHQVGDMEDGSVYVVVEQLAGEPLATLLPPGHTLAPGEALELVLQAAAGLQAAHRAGFVHGNLSPHTILVMPVGQSRSLVKLIGFSLDPAFRQDAVKPPAAGYASPERLVGQAADERSDVYSLGAVLHHLLTGMPPNRGHVDGSAPEAARSVLEFALAPAPERRFQTVAEMSAALERLGPIAGDTRQARTRPAVRLGAAAAGVAIMATGIWLLPGGTETGVTPGGEDRALQVGDTTDREGPGLGSAPTRAAPVAPVPARSPSPVPPAAGQDAPRPRVSSPGTNSRGRDDPPAGVRPDTAPRAPPPAPGRTELADADTSRQIDTARGAALPPAEPPTPSLESRAQVYLRIGLDEASRQLGRPVHAIEGMTPLFLGLARSPFPGYAAAGPAVRAVYMGPNGSLILLDQQRMRPGRSVTGATTTRWRIGDVMLYLHGEARPRVLSSLARRVR